MTKWWWRSDDSLSGGNIVGEPEGRGIRRSHSGVEFVIARMTFGRRLELMRRVRDLAARLEFFEAGRDAGNEMEASLLGAEIDRLYLMWGLEEIRGLGTRWRNLRRRNR